MLFPTRIAGRPALTALLGAAEPLADLAYAHTRSNPPPPAKEALPENDGAGQAGYPFELVARGYVRDREGGVDEREQDCARTKGRGATVRAPRLLAVHDEPPDRERKREEDGERRIADVPHRARHIVELLTRVERRELHPCGKDSEGTEQDENELRLEAGGIHEGKKLDVRDL